MNQKYFFFFLFKESLNWKLTIPGALQSRICLRPTFLFLGICLLGLGLGTLLSISNWGLVSKPESLPWALPFLVLSHYDPNSVKMAF